MLRFLADEMIVHHEILVVDGDLDLIASFQGGQALVSRLFARQEPRE
jgi:hypothetical protein